MNDGPSPEQLKDISFKYEKTDYVGAITQVIYLLGQFASSLILHNFMAMSHTKLGNYDAAIKCYIKIIAIEPQNPNNHFNFANTHMIMGDFTLAIAAYENLLKIDPNDHEAYHNMGICWKEVDDTSNAIESFRSALSLNPEFVLSQEELKQALEKRTNSNNFLKS